MIRPLFLSLAALTAGASAQEWADKPEIQALIDDVDGAEVLGELIYWRNVESAFLGPRRNVSIWLPPGYDDPANAGRRYPVIYMTDGQNLFDPRIANTGTDWGIDEAMVRGAEAGRFEPAIVVATWSTEARGPEYSPWAAGPSYARFVIEELKPRVDGEFRTRPDRPNTYAMGSSMGGLLAMHLVMDHSETFSACGCVSTHVPISPRWIATYTGQDPDGADPTPFTDLAMQEGNFDIPEGARMFFDYGTKTLDAEYGPGHERMRRHFKQQGLTEGEDFLIREYEGAAHDEASWRARVEDQLIWMLGGEVPAG
jgi:enterochelin esterase-like enzyme